MMNQRLVQAIALAVAVGCVSASGALLPDILRRSDESVLRYTNVSVEGAPPFVAIGTAIGALRGLIVDYLWIKANAMKERGLFYEAMADADLITKLQPRFAQVWAFHGHNMAYNISVATHTQAERWEWVNAGIRLVRDKGLRYNPNNMVLHRELAFWFQHKIEGVADDAHLYYKRALCDEWHMLLGEPPEDSDARTAWIKEIADAPATIEAAIRQTPQIDDLIQRLEAALPERDAKLKLDREFLTQYGRWVSVKRQSAAAKVLGVEERWRAEFPAFVAFDEVAEDPALDAAWKALLAHARKRVLRDEYNMDPQLMYEYTRDLGPIDWRHAGAHALYWSRRGSEFGKGRLSDEDIYIVLNNDSQQLQAMQELFRSGRIYYDPFSSELPGRFPEPRWIDTIARLFEPFYLKHIDVRGAGGERFINFLKNFMASAIRELYRSGEVDRAKTYMAMLDSLFGRGVMATNEFKVPVDAYVWDNTRNEYEAQPHVAPNDVAASLRYGLLMGILHNRPEVFRQSLEFANKVTEWFKNNTWNDYTTKFGEQRMADILADLDDSLETAYLSLLRDPGIKLHQRMAIWSQTDRIEQEVLRRRPILRGLTYDRIMPIVEQQFAMHELSQQMKVTEAFPPPPGLEEARTTLIRREQQRQQQREENNRRDPIERRG